MLFRVGAHYVQSIEKFGKVSSQSCEHTELLLELFNLTGLWEDYGAVGNLVVSC